MDRDDSCVCRVSGLEKSFGKNRVLKGVDLDLPAGQVTVLMGANGAGKSTLVKVLCGVHHADGGAVTLGGADFAPVDAADAIAQGIVTVHQSIDDGVIPDLDVASNLMLDRLTAPGAGFFVNDRALRRAARQVAASMQLDVDVTRPVSEMGVADRQMIAIARAMARAPRLLILDEPTSSLSATEAERLFALIDRLRGQGVAVLYISHRMSDIRRIADRIVSMRDGQVAGVFEGEVLDYEAAVTAMLGHAMSDVDNAPAIASAPILRLDGVRLLPGAAPVDLTAHAGEVLAITGLLGSGKSALAEIVFGLRSLTTGDMTLDGAEYAPRDAGEAVARGVFLSPKDRGRNAVVPDFDISDNMTLPFLKSFSRLSLLGSARQAKAANRMIGDLGIVCQGPGDAITTLSGGNQQKVMIARWLLQPSRVLLLDEPFQGVDIGARRDIGRHIRATADGRATIVFVSEIDEALEIADRIVVLYEGQVAGEHRAGAFDPAALVADVTGKIADEAAA